ncbi:MAG: hypothetical protein LBR00_07795, partial [Clostridiales Family XIII bacterium]|nr:hypothetical protein [Clostridiales Family XIII bacterium]
DKFDLHPARRVLLVKIPREVCQRHGFKRLFRNPEILSGFLQAKALKSIGSERFDDAFVRLRVKRVDRPYERLRAVRIVCAFQHDALAVWMQPLLVHTRRIAFVYPLRKNTAKQSGKSVGALTDYCRLAPH